LVQPQQRHSILAAFAVVASQTSNALGAAWSKSLFDQLGVEGLVALRVGFAALLVGVLTRAWRMRVSRDQVGNLLGYSIALGLMNSIAY
jgi:inner membrane transporter RhtA